MEKFRELFIEESLEILQNIEQILIELEEYSDDAEKISALFRCMHTIKGNAAMFGFNSISTFAHEIESFLDELRNGRISVSKRIIDLLLASADDIRGMLHPADNHSDDPKKAADIIVRQLQQIVRLQIPDAPNAEEVTYRITFRPSEDIFLTGTNPLLLLDELRGLGEYSCTGNFENIPPLTEMDPEKCYTEWDILLTSRADIRTVRDVFIFIDGTSDIDIQLIHDEVYAEPEGLEKRLGEILIERGDIDHGILSDALNSQKRLGELLLEKKELSEKELAAALAEQEHLQKLSEKRKDELQTAQVKVRSEKLDVLVDLVGELVTTQAQLRQISTEITEPALNTVTEHLERLISNLRDSAMSIRMLPIGTIFSRFRRMVRDLSLKLGKQVELVIEGAQTELDKTVIERLQDPLMHLIRNCIDHGIETPQERMRIGKPETGVVRLSAFHSGTSVLINVEDDVVGLNRKAILETSKEKGLIGHDIHLNDQEAFDLIFAPGFSTADELTDISGRGVGLDVVRREIENLQGTVSVSSRRNEGSIFTLKLPLTLAIIEGLLFHDCGQFFVVPLSNVEECVEFSGLNVDEKSHRKMVNVRDSAVSYVRLRELFDLTRREGKRTSIEQMIIMRNEKMRIGLVVDGVIGNHQTVIKSLGTIYKDLEGISGATILGDGSIAFILDMNSIAGMVNEASCMKVC